MVLAGASLVGIAHNYLFWPLNTFLAYINIKINNQLDRNFAPFSDTDTVDAIKASRNSTAAGPNGITMLHLKHLGPLGIRFLTHLFNLSVQAADFSAI